MGDAFREERERQQKQKNERRKSNSELVLLWEGDYNYRVVIHTESHFSLFKEDDGRRLDFWPSTGTAVWFDKNKRPGKHFKIGNIEEYIFAHFKRVK